jgi:ethanolamine permease
MLAPPAIAFSIGSYFHTLFPSLPILGVAFGAYVVFTAINAWGVRLSAAFELFVTILAVAELLLFGAVTAPKFSWAHFSADALPHGVSGIFAAVPFAIWFYLAIEGVANVAEEARDPQRDIPRGFLSAIATLVVLTALVLFAAVGVDGWHSVVYPAGSTDTSDSPLPLAIGHVVDRNSPLFTVLTGVGLLGLVASFHGILIAASRALLEYGRTGYAPAIVGEIHPTRHTPIAALVLNAVVGSIALLTGKTGDIITISVFGALTLYIVSMASLFRLRMKEPNLARPYRTPFYPVVPAVALVLAIVCLVAMTWFNAMLALIYAGIVIASFAVFLVVRRMNPSAASAMNKGAHAAGDVDAQP